MHVMARGARQGGMLVAAALALLPGGAFGQLCNSDDPAGGTLVIHAFGSSGTQHVCYKNTTTLLDQMSSTNTEQCKRAAYDRQPMAVVYLLLLLWFFLGVGIVADVFMEAIGKPTIVPRIPDTMMHGIAFTLYPRSGWRARACLTRSISASCAHGASCCVYAYDLARGCSCDHKQGDILRDH